MKKKHTFGWATLFMMCLLALIAGLWNSSTTPKYANDYKLIADSTWASDPCTLVCSSVRNKQILDSIPGVQSVSSVQEGDSVTWYILPDSVSTYNLTLY